MSFKTHSILAAISIPGILIALILAGPAVGEQFEQINLYYSINEISWSPDSQWLAFSARGDTLTKKNAQGLYVVDSKGEHFKRLSKSGTKPVWSPDSTRLVFWKDRQLTVIDRDGNHRNTIFETSANIRTSGIVWLPDDNIIAFTVAGVLYARYADTGNDALISEELRERVEGHPSIHQGDDGLYTISTRAVNLGLFDSAKPEHYSPDGTLLVGPSGDFNHSYGIRVVESNSRAEIFRLKSSDLPGNRSGLFDWQKSEIIILVAVTIILTGFIILALWFLRGIFKLGNVFK